MGMRDFRLGIETLKNRGVNAMETILLLKGFFSSHINFPLEKRHPLG